MLMTKLFNEQADQIREMKYYDALQTQLVGKIPVLIGATGWTRELGYEIYLRDSSYGDELWERVYEAGEEFEIAPICPSQIRRMQGGILNWGCDMTEENNPFEVYEPFYIQILLSLRPRRDTIGKDYLDVDFSNSQFKKEDFRGKEELTRIKSEGAKQRLVGLQIYGEKLDMTMNESTQWPIYKGRSKIGHVTSACFAPYDKMNIAYGMIPTEYSKKYSYLRVSVPGSDRPRKSQIVGKPFIDEEAVRAKS